MTTEAPTVPEINLNPNDATVRVLSDVYRLKADYRYASDEYVARRDDGARPLQWHLEWEALSFRFSDNPDTNPIIQRSVNVIDKNGQPATWGDPTNPEPTKDDSFPIQLSKYFAKCGVIVGTDPHVLDGRIFVAERRTLKAGNTEIDTLVPVQLLAEFTPPDPIRVVQSKERGTAGNPATGAAAAAPAGPSKDEALKALATAMAGKTAADLVAVALENTTVQGNGDVLAMAAQGTPAVEALKALGEWDAKGKFTPKA